MALLVAAFFVVALPAGGYLGLKSAWSWKPVVLAEILGFLLAEGISFITLSGPWPRARFVGDIAYFGYQICLWLASFTLGVALGAWSKAGRFQRVAALILGVGAIPIVFVRWIGGTIAINCFNQIGQMCY